MTDVPIHDVERIIEIAYLAGQAILRLYDRDIAVEYKADDTPLTDADRASNRVIVDGLKSCGDLPILSEESRQVSYDERRAWRRFWLVDPLDGTKEFLKRNGEFTVNIALVEDGRPILGVVYGPVVRRLYVGQLGVGAFRADEETAFSSLDELRRQARSPAASWRRLPLAATDNRDGVRVVASRSHQNAETRAFIERLRQRHGEVELVSIGSSLKLCLVAEGSADVYPRIAPTMEWDTAAAHAVVAAAGGAVIEARSGQPLQYNKKDLLNPHFVVHGVDSQDGE